MADQLYEGRLINIDEREAIFPNCVNGGVYIIGSQLKCVKAIFGIRAVHFDNEDHGVSIYYHRSPIEKIHHIMLDSIGQCVRVLAVKHTRDYDRGFYIVANYDEIDKRFLLIKRVEEPKLSAYERYFKSWSTPVPDQQQ